MNVVMQIETTLKLHSLVFAKELRHCYGSRECLIKGPSTRLLDKQENHMKMCHMEITRSRVDEEAIGHLHSEPHQGCDLF